MPLHQGGRQTSAAPTGTFRQEMYHPMEKPDLKLRQVAGRSPFPQWKRTTASPVVRDDSSAHLHLKDHQFVFFEIDMPRFG